jgi:hypothetical protein
MVEAVEVSEGKEERITAGTGLFTAPENGWEIYWSLFKFPNHLHKGTIV